RRYIHRPVLRPRCLSRRSGILDVHCPFPGRKGAELMDTIFTLTVAVFYAVGFYLMLSRHIVRILLGIAIFGNAVNLTIFTAGRITRLMPPIIPLDMDVLPAGTANPLPQALILTAIVISFSFFAFLLVLTFRRS